MAPYPEIPAFTCTVTRLTDGPLIAESLFGRSEIAGLEPCALANINGRRCCAQPLAGKAAIFRPRSRRWEG